ncbi:MAG: family 78 glycoside hydrolase catalytic domain, partial [Syntrophomonadaceae bacterium]|nr:family 78 glycoside hydrolase catalytic domain [Syntrophomonadaceae bacterium]
MDTGKENKIYALSVENLLSCPAVIMNKYPSLSWKISADREGARQTAYQIQAASNETLLQSNSPDLWDSGKQLSEQSLYILWKDATLQARQEVFWRVRIWDENGQASDYSEIAYFRLGLLQNSHWQANWIYFDGNNSSHSAPCPFFRKEFSVSSDLQKAHLYISARGLFSASINGSKISADEFVPGWTDYHQQLQYLSYDVKDCLQRGNNALGVILGDGWYTGFLMGRRRNLYGRYPELLLQLELEYKDGRREIVLSDGEWKCTTGPILYSDIYDGEMYDERLQMPGWNCPDFEDSAWQPVKVGERAAESKAELVAKVCPPVRKIAELKPVKRTNPRQDVYIWDFGQNLTGWVRLKVRGRAGQLYTCHFG